MDGAFDWLACEKECRKAGFFNPCGIDEAGRGPLAGPVFAAAVILPEGVFIEGLNDSKKLSEKKRENLFGQICAESKAWSVAFADVEEIERENILNATFVAMRRAFDGLSCPADFVLIDGNQIRLFDRARARAIVGGDGCCASIAAASILAKVSRDRYMKKLAEKYPGYGFEKHKGYGTKAHVEAILRLGPCPAHRMSFLKKILPANTEKSG